MSAPAPSARPRRRLGLRIRRQRGLIQVGYRDVALELSDSAQTLFENADGVRTVCELADLLVEEFGISRTDALVDATEFIDFMVRSQLMVIAADDAPPAL